MKGLGKLNRAFPFLPSPKISEFLSSGPEGGIFKPWQEFYFVTLTLKSHANFGTTLNAAFIISLSKIGQFLLTWWKGSKFHILLLSFVRKENWLNQKTITGVLFCDTEEPCKLWDNTECCFPYKPPPQKKIGQFLLTGRKGSKFEILFLCLVWKVNYLNQKTLTGVFFCDTEGPWKVWKKTESCFSNQFTNPPTPEKKKLINSFLAEEKCPDFRFYSLILYGKKIAWTKKPSQGFYFVTLKSHANFGIKLNAAFQISPPKIGQFLSSGRKVSKFHILLLSFVRNINCLNEKTFTGNVFGGTEGPCELWAKTEFCSSNKPPKNWSISFQREKSSHISDFIAFFCMESKLFEPDNLLFPKRDKCPNFRFYFFVLSEKQITWTRQPSQEFYFVTLKSHANFEPKLNSAS